mmetsp:Transcript_27987/g.83875  ORF Transcript_27987/g.83875 Transcript_27987/m.83875 type:complete len:177 (-) Transcript_27987:56-586(-)|eukprot:CAMPEP_0119292266 /NCGR_PEP_ID=MMETSP1329-20130426/43823_1 /TAXON_ID=114041 /ORGANISM="Genus nov. species nov., Strain RCC1024" /LENGTH=176 /DNA_ID=CAMNT_0007293101 /DNA_START=251 /DNA_END=781 /DNA_ORIENTATION=+
MLVDTMTEPGPTIVGLEDAERSFAIPDSVRNAADAKVSFPSLNYCYQQGGFGITLRGDGAGGLALRVVNSGGLICDIAGKGPVSTFLQQADHQLGFSLCDLSNKYKESVYGREGDDWMPSEQAPYFAFESKYKAASKRLMTTAATLELSGSGCALDGSKFSAPTFVAALETFNQVA